MNNHTLVLIAVCIFSTAACNANRNTAHVDAVSVDIGESAAPDFEPYEVEEEFVCKTRVIISYEDSDGDGQIVADTLTTRLSGEVEEVMTSFTSGGSHTFEFVEPHEDRLESFEFIMLEEGTTIGTDARVTVRIQYTIDPEIGRACGRIGFHRQAFQVSIETGEEIPLSWGEDLVSETPPQPRSYLQHSIELEPGDLLWFFFD